MNIATRKSRLVHALKVLSAVADPKSTMPALACVLIEANGRDLNLTCTDLTNTVFISIGLDHGVPWMDKSRVCVPLKALKDAVKSCAKAKKRGDDPMIMLEWFGRDLTVSAPDSARFTLEGLNVDLFPEIVEPDSKEDEFVAYSNLHEALAFVAPAICQDETRFHLNSVAFIGTDIVATDGCRLHRQANMPNIPSKHYGVSHLIPVATVKALRAGMEDKFGTVFAWFKEWHHSDAWRQHPTQKGSALFQFYYNHCHHSIWCKTVDAKFPPFEQVIPRDARVAFEIDRKTLANVCLAAKKSATYGRGLGFDKESANYLRASVENPERKMAMSVLAKIDGDVNVCVDPRYLFDIIDALSEDTVSVRLTDKEGPVRIDGTNRVAVVMPMRRD